ANAIGDFWRGVRDSEPKRALFLVIDCVVLAHAMANASICGGSRVQTPKQKYGKHASMIPVFWRGVRDSNH
ncbi:MAG: hypothetical protein J6B71_01290, partial [Clostridia bacterium]|nr:hypothetical protein [Clostridia bacterium]